MQFLSKLLVISFIIGFSLFNVNNLFSQIHYSHRFTKKLKKTHMTFVEPVEGFYKIRMLKRDEFLKYDLVLESEEKAFEMRFLINPSPSISYPHIAHFNLANSLATNHQHFNLEMQFFEEEDVKSVFHADWAAFADFIPKRSLTDKHFARLVTLYNEAYGMAHLLLLFNSQDREKDLRLYTLSFESKPVPE
jgi:hypothetical protein